MTNGIYRLYRHYPSDQQRQMRMVGRFSVLDGRVTILEDHDGLLEGLVNIPNQTSRLERMSRSPYWSVVAESDIESGEYPELLPEM